MVLDTLPLSREHLEMARDLWDALNKAPNYPALEQARARLVSAPNEVRTAILCASAEQWKQGSNLAPLDNPFAQMPSLV
jgi:hypothetical protein